VNKKYNSSTFLYSTFFLKMTAGG